jgi:hypothetical protein
MATAQVPKDRWARPKRAYTFAKAEFDAILAILAGIGVAIATIAGASAQVTGAATLFVLAAVAAALLRDRRARDKLETTLDDGAAAVDRVEAAIATHVQSLVGSFRALSGTVDGLSGDLAARMSEIERALAALDSPFPYEVLTQVFTWEIEASGDALLRKRQTVRFIRDGRVLEQEWTGSGSEPRFEMWILRDGHRFRRLDEVGAIQIPYGAIRVISLGRLYRRGDELDLEAERDRPGAFATPDESVEIRGDAYCRQSTAELFWPAEREPGDIKLEGPQPGAREDLTDRLERLADGRWHVHQRLGEVKIGETATIEWKW